MEILVTGILYVVYPVQKRHCIRSNSIWHMYYLEQNLLLSTNDNNLVLKIADFRFARSLQPRGLVETLCGSPLYMAPKIMQLQKYDAKLLQNIVKYSELHFPPDNNDLSADCKDLCQKLLRRNPVERLTFEEFFNHPFLSQKQPNEALRRSSRIIDGFPLSECNSVRKTEASSQEDCMSFPLDDDSSGAEGSPSFLRKRSSMKSTYGFSPDKKVDIRETIFNTPNNMDLASKYSSASYKPEITSFRIDSLRPSDENVKEPLKSMEQRPMRSCSRGSAPLTSVNMKTKSSAPMPIAGVGITNTCYTRSLESHSSAPSETSQGSMDIGDALERPSTHCITRIKSLQQCASIITELVNEKKTGSSGFDGIFGYGRLKKWDQLGGVLNDQKGSSWKMVYVDYENDVLLVGDDPQNEFVGCVRCIRILSPSEVQQMSEEGMQLLNSTTIEGINDSIKRWKPWLHQGLIINPGNLGCTQPQARLRQSGCRNANGSSLGLLF
ncbi:Serine/threonine-protein kinase ATG1c [Vitis vinifera]|uniref:Auxin-responsive protein n=2 Tax=Vitis vinifera TaxID=29760 RepID=A0A438IX47_VITVI|nr:Serine/threonine-protein kinase ATG1c [Vitis vinifera]